MGLMRTQSRCRCCALAVKKAATIDRALGFSPSATASSRSRRTISAGPAVAFSILRSLSPGANNHERALLPAVLFTICFDPRRCISRSIRFGQAQDLLGQKVQNHVRADGCRARDEDLAQIALDMIFLRITHAAQGQHGGMARLEPEFTGQV